MVEPQTGIAADDQGRVRAARSAAGDSADDKDFPVEPWLTNLGDQPARISTLCGQPGHRRGPGDWDYTFTPDWFKSDRPPDDAIAKRIVALAPGRTAPAGSFTARVSNAFFKDKDYVTVSLGYWVHD